MTAATPRAQAGAAAPPLPKARLSLPTTPTMRPMPLVSLPTMTSTGPMAAANSATFTMTACVPLLMPWNRLMSPSAPAASFCRYGRMMSPKPSPTRVAWLRRIFIFPENVCVAFPVRSTAPLDPCSCLTRSATSKRPSRIAAAMSGPARAPKSSSALAAASPPVLAFLIDATPLASAAGRSLTPSFAIFPSAMRSDPMTSLVLTPALSNEPSVAMVWSTPKPSWRSGEP